MDVADATAPGGGEHAHTKACPRARVPHVASTARGRVAQRACGSASRHCRPSKPYRRTDTGVGWGRRGPRHAAIGAGRIVRSSHTRCRPRSATSQLSGIRAGRDPRGQQAGARAVHNTQPPLRARRATAPARTRVTRPRETGSRPRLKASSPSGLAVRLLVQAVGGATAGAGGWRCRGRRRRCSGRLARSRPG